MAMVFPETAAVTPSNRSTASCSQKQPLFPKRLVELRHQPGTRKREMHPHPSTSNHHPAQ